MKYYFFSVQNVNDGTNPCAAFYYNTMDEAVSAFHSTLASNYINSNLNGFLCMVVDSNGSIIRSESWTKPTNE